MAAVAGCAACHASPGAAGDILGGGRQLPSGFGTFRAPNISSDPVAGIGAWTLPEFDRAVRHGIAPDGRAYFPAFPYPDFARMSDADVADIYAWLQSVSPSPAVQPGHDLRFPLTIPGAARAWQRLYFRRGPAVVLANADDQVRRGQYLVEGPGHCGACHTPRDAMGAPRRGRWLGGAELPDGKGYAPNLTPHPDGLGSRTATEIVAALRPRGPGGDGMDAVRAGLAQLPDSDLFAIAAYLRALPSVAP